MMSLRLFHIMQKNHNTCCNKTLHFFHEFVKRHVIEINLMLLKLIYCRGSEEEVSKLYEVSYMLLCCNTCYLIILETIKVLL